MSHCRVEAGGCLLDGECSCSCSSCRPRKRVAGQEGPKLTIAASCSGCAYLEVREQWVGEGLSEVRHENVACTHGGRFTRSIGRDTRVTPEWCPFLAAATEAFRQS